MKKELKRVPIDEGVLGYLQALHAEMEGLRVLNCQIVRSGDNAGGNYERFMADYREACRTFRCAYDQLVQELALDCLGPGYASEISFLTGELVVYQEAEV